MNKDLLKGVLMLAAIAALVLGLFFALSDTAGGKAGCIARALKNGTPVGKIEKVCQLVSKSY